MLFSFHCIIPFRHCCTGHMVWTYSNVRGFGLHNSTNIHSLLEKLVAAVIWNFPRLHDVLKLNDRYPRCGLTASKIRPIQLDLRSTRQCKSREFAIHPGPGRRNTFSNVTRTHVNMNSPSVLPQFQLRSIKEIEPQIRRILVAEFSTFPLAN